ncbi:zinc finger protein 93-like isoform X1 [Frankliniella occidentalis]|uniref:Zinc finger protein 93-like isoform X1 n=2 Tax=Frankliniella occidentalis TaxID=133901 RepID=A0A9C6WZM5_FRAOC|nr:zinc finger protein 93-like isoform X1 [Frankliniella occidentalis]XP_052126243.1 zinc finger protein 93-like isoform X1 [Frankliniella occidentalis]XP_052126244.1 zinc finger protein 93-like isoform X1 [Frankliniella occidentalis]
MTLYFTPSPTSNLYSDTKTLRTMDSFNDHPGRLCRLCAQPETEDKLIYIYKENEEVEDHLAEIINLSLPIKVSQIDHLPKQICQSCLEKLQATHEFALSCLATEQELQELFAANKFQSVGDSSDNSLGDTLKDKIDLKLSTSTSAALCEKSTDNLSDLEEGKLEEFMSPLQCRSSESYQCPLCCDGEMGSCLDEPVELGVQNHISPQKSFEEELMAQYNRANEEDDSSSSVVEEDLESELESITEVVVDENIDQRDAAISIGNNSSAGPAKKLRQLKGIPKHRQIRRQKHRVTAARGKRKVQGKAEESDALIWIKADNEESIPLVQCIHCSGWLPGYASCLQHSLTSHIDVDAADQKTYHCARCEGVSVSTHSDLINHFKKSHCPNHEFEVEECNGQFVVSDKSQSKALSEASVPRDITYNCSICEKGFNWLLNLLQHSCSQVNCNDLYCNICDQEYRNRQRFVFHMNFHSDIAPALMCDVCDQSFADDSLLYDHVRFAHVTENVECSECGKDFRSEKGLTAHQMLAHNSDPTMQNRHKCTTCGKCYRDKQGLKEHLVTHMSEKPFPCDKCDRAYNRYSRLKQHQLSHVYTESMECYECVNCGLAFPDMDKALAHSTSEEHEVQNTVLAKLYRCEYCDTVFSCPDGLNQHRPSHVGEKPFVCHICGASFHTYSRVTTHKTTHGIYDQIEPQEGDFTIPRHFLCEHCGVSYPYWSYLQTHRKMRHSENPYSLSCKLCPEKFKNSWSVVYHRKKVHENNGETKEWRKRTLQCPHCGVNCMYQHTLSMHIERKHGSLLDDDGKRESYQCEECGKVFKYQSSLLLHQKMHQGQKSFQCEECDKSFLTIATLRNHTKRCHQGIKPHQCEYCGKAFFHRVTRDDHLRVHTGEKPFKCQFCDKRFRLKSMLTDHAKIHNDHRPYPCDVCGTSFRRMVHMKQHRMLHTGEKPFQCRYCGQDFRLKQELQRHMKSKHGELAVENIEEEEYIFADQ